MTTTISIAILSILLGLAACSSLGPVSELPRLPMTPKGYTVLSGDSRVSVATAAAILESLNAHKGTFSSSPRDCRVSINGPMMELVPSRYIQLKHPFKPDIAIALFEPTTNLQILQVVEQQAGQSRFYVSRDRRMISEVVRILDAAL